MAEAEDVITDVARHATVWVRALWRRHRPVPAGPPQLQLADTAERLDLLLTAALGVSLALRPAPAGRPVPLLQRWLGARRGDAPLPRQPIALPATDGQSVWLPPALPVRPEVPDDRAAAAARYRVLALRQALLVRRGTPEVAQRAATPALRDLLLCIESLSVDADLLALLPGLRPPLLQIRHDALAMRPPLARYRGLPLRAEQALRTLLAMDPAAPHAPGTPRMPRMPVGGDVDGLGACATAEASLQRAQHWWQARAGDTAPPSATAWLWPALWSGRLSPPAPRQPAPAAAPGPSVRQPPQAPPRSARLQQRPRVRAAADDEDDAGPGAWMVQTSQPHESAADPMGLQRPTDRDADLAAEDLADAVGELPEARLVSAPGAPKEVLLSDDPPQLPARRVAQPAAPGAAPCFHYPEWDCQASAYRQPGAVVHVGPCADGDPAWVDATRRAHAAMLAPVRRRFEMLRAQRLRLHRQPDGDDVDIDAWTAAQADRRAGLPLPQGLYTQLRARRRQLAIGVLVDSSGSTDAWVSAGRRVIDVAREALLLLGEALQGLHEPFAIQAFSGQGAGGVVVREIKPFDDPWSRASQLRIAGLEPEHFTRVGAALRHATAGLMQQPARHRLLLLVSDGRPNDDDAYDGRYGVEDFRQAVAEARLQGISVFCLTVDRQAAGYLPRVFGPQHHALVPEPERLPAALLQWMRRLVTA